jgi:hypothetical protein
VGVAVERVDAQLDQRVGAALIAVAPIARPGAAVGEHVQPGQQRLRALSREDRADEAGALLGGTRPHPPRLDRRRGPLLRAARVGLQSFPAHLAGERRHVPAGRERHRRRLHRRRGRVVQQGSGVGQQPHVPQRDLPRGQRGKSERQPVDEFPGQVDPVAHTDARFTQRGPQLLLHEVPVQIGRRRTRAVIGVDRRDQPQLHRLQSGDVALDIPHRRNALIKRPCNRVEIHSKCHTATLATTSDSSAVLQRRDDRRLWKNSPCRSRTPPR